MPDVESHFLGNLVSILLESCCTSLDYDEKIFQYPLHACEFEDYMLTVSWRAKNLTYVPKFADTIASQLHHSNTFGNSEFDIKQRFKIKRTLTFQFQPTMVQTQLTDHKISTLESYSQISVTNISTLNSINQQSWNQNLGILFLFSTTSYIFKYNLYCNNMVIFLTYFIYFLNKLLLLNIFIVNLK